MLAETDEEWERKLEILVASPDLRRRMGELALEVHPEGAFQGVRFPETGGCTAIGHTLREGVNPPAVWRAPLPDFDPFMLMCSNEKSRDCSFREISSNPLSRNHR